MDDVVAVKVRDAKSGVHFFITWGRIFDRVDPKTLELVVEKHVAKFGIKHPTSVTLCDSLQEASKARYFHEALFHLSQERIPFGKGTYSRWRSKMRRSMLAGRQIDYCGSRPAAPSRRG